jgi:hypothetical protein
VGKTCGAFGLGEKLMQQIGRKTDELRVFEIHEYC